MKLHPLVIALGLTSLVGCGGSSSSNPEPTPDIQLTYPVRAVDGYLRNAQVWLDINGNYQLDEGEPQAMSGEGGVATLDVTNTPNPEQYSIIVKAIAAQTIDEDTITETNPNGVVTTIPYLLSAPAGQTVITPLSTLVNIKMKNGLDQQQAISKVASDLGIAEESLLGDYIAAEQGDIAAKANALVELAVLPESEQDMKEVSQDDSRLNEQLAVNIEKVQALTAEQRLFTDENGEVIVATNIDSDDDGVIDQKDTFPEDANEWLDSDKDGMGDNADAFPNDATETLDGDNDGVGDNSDAFPNDATETLDSDNDGMGDNSDAFPNDATETLDSDNDGMGDNSDTFPNDATETIDSDNDGMGDNSDAFPNDATETLDSDGDGTGDNTDAYKDDANKSILDTVTSKSYTTPFIHPTFKSVTIVEVDEETRTETFHNGDIQITTGITYTTPKGVQYGDEVKSELLKSDGSFTRINEWRYDFDLDGESLFIGKALDIGHKTENGESYLMYCDESDAALEGGDNGGGRVFNDVDLTSRSHPSDLSQIDFVASVTIERRERSTTAITITKNFEQYPAAGFDYTNIDASQPEYADTTIQLVTENGEMLTIEKFNDWEADGTINESIQLAIGTESEYQFIHKRPVWATPTDAVDEEYADFNFAGGWDSLTNYWYETSDSVDAQKVRTYQGRRYVLNTENEANIKLEDTDNPNGLLFNEYISIQKTVSGTERNEFVTWQHYPLADYDFTVDSEDVGQSYKVFQKQSNGIWVGYGFPEWGSQNIIDLAGKIETARADGIMLSNIDSDIIPGLSEYNLPTSTPSFAHDASGKPITWYFVTNNDLFSSNGYMLKEVSLTDNGMQEGWLTLTGPDQFIFLQPTVEQPWDWFDAYNRIWSGISAIDTTENSFMWSNWLGEFYLDETQAQARLADLQTKAFSEKWLSGKTLYVVWFGDGDLANEQGQAIDHNGDLINNSADEIELNNVAVVQEITFNIDGTLTAKGLKNAINLPEGAPYHYIVDQEGVLRFVEEQNEATEGNIICDNSHPDYLKTHFVLSDENGVEQFDNVDLFFFDKQAALDYAETLTTSIPPCNI